MMPYPRGRGSNGPPMRRPPFHDIGVFGVEKPRTMMPYPRGRGGNGLPMRHPPMRRPPFNDNYEYNDYDNNYEPTGGGMPNQMPDRWAMQRELPHLGPPFPPSRQQEPKRPVNANCGELRVKDAGMLVRMTGRVQYQRLNRFLSLRDSHGTTQLVISEEKLNLIKLIRNIPLDSHIEIIGTVERRPSTTVNVTMSTGEIEVTVNEILDILKPTNVAAPKRKLYELSGEEAPGRTGKKARSSILITSGEVARCGESINPVTSTAAAKKKFHQRTHNCGELNENNANKDVTLCGWVESKRNERFVVLRDGYGFAQLVFNTIDYVVSSIMKKAEVNTLLMVKGTVNMRPSHQQNSRMATGSIEVKVTSVEIIDPNEPDPGVDDEPEDQMELGDSKPSLPPPGDVNSYCNRTHTCGELRGSDAGKEVSLCGWLDSQRTNRFGIIRDGHGSTQLLIPTDLESTLGKEMANTPLESVIKAIGTVCARPPEQVTEKVSTGEVEVLVKEFSVLNPAKRDLPFVIRERNRPKEHLRMKYRYLDMRFTDMQYRLRMRSKVLMRMREFLINQRGFVEVETPTLFKRTPGGAQEFVVPTRAEDKFYSLVQSPQQLKQLLMVGAIDRYFQVARCYRDEGARPDRQPEFTQMDIELSFTDRECIIALIEDLLKASWPEELKGLSTPFPVITYHEAMHWYGTDKPDLSFDKKLVDISELITDEKKKLLPEVLRNVENFTAKGLVFGPNNLKVKTALKECEELQKKKKQNKAKLIGVKCMGDSKWKKNVEGALPFVDAEKLQNFLNFPATCTFVVGIGKESEVLPLLGKLRQDVFGVKSSNFNFAWIVDFPLFLEGDDGNLESAHHPFTQACAEDCDLLKTDPLKVRGLHFDLVLNGYEVGGGSVRIHDAATQTRVLKDILKIPVNSLEHLLEALDSGAPPHGGIALGMDRLLSIMLGADTIREVIAFPKGVDGRDPLCGAPCSISDEEKRMYHLLPKLSKNEEK